MEWEKLPVIDWELAVSLACNNRELAEEVLTFLLKDLKSDINKIKYACQMKSYSTMLYEVHKLHGALCYCGLPRLKKLIFHLETLLKHDILDGLSFLVEKLDSESSMLYEYVSCPHHPQVAKTVIPEQHIYTTEVE